LFAGYKGDVVIIFFIPGLDAIPSQAVVQREVARYTPTVFRVEAQVFVAAIEWPKLVLRVFAGDTQQEIGEGDSGLAAVDYEGAVEESVGMRVDLVVL
jgi:hypothetical protein